MGYWYLPYQLVSKISSINSLIGNVTGIAAFGGLRESNSMYFFGKKYYRYFMSCTSTWYPKQPCFCMDLWWNTPPSSLDLESSNWQPIGMHSQRHCKLVQGVIYFPTPGNLKQSNRCLQDWKKWWISRWAMKIPWLFRVYIRLYCPVMWRLPDRSARGGAGSFKK